LLLSCCPARQFHALYMDAISIDAIQSLIKIPMTLLRCSTSAAITTATCTPPTNLQAEVAEQGVKPRLQGCKG